MNREFEQFNRTMDTILKADPKAVKEAMEADKRENAEKRRAKKQPSSLDRASTEKD